MSCLLHNRDASLQRRLGHHSPGFAVPLRTVESRTLEVRAGLVLQRFTHASFPTRNLPLAKPSVKGTLSFQGAIASSDALAV